MKILAYLFVLLSSNSVYSEFVYIPSCHEFLSHMFLIIRFVLCFQYLSVAEICRVVSDECGGCSEAILLVLSPCGYTDDSLSDSYGLNFMFF